MSAQPQVNFDWKLIPGIADPKFIVIDLFCGAGGTSTGYKYAKLRKKMCAIVAAAINHDEKALESHWKNNMEVVHFNEDITKLYGHLETYGDGKKGYLLMSPEFLKLIRMVEIYRACYPNAKIILWASLECTNFSKAKGGQARDADSRTLAEHLDRYIHYLQPDYIKIENVVEFMAWGPMRIKCKKVHTNTEYPYSELALIWDKKSKQHVYGWEPISKKNGQDWLKWRNQLCSMGYEDKWKELNSADYGAYTSRNRLFGIFHRPELPASFPKPTHAKNPSKEQTLFSPMEKWNPVKHVLDFSDEGDSILNRIEEIRVFKWVKQNCKPKERVYNFEKSKEHAKGLLRGGKTVKELILLPAGIDKPFTHHPYRFVLTQDMLPEYNSIVDQYIQHYGSVAFHFDDKLSPKTFERVYSGLVKYVAGGKKEYAFLQQTYACASNNDANYPVDNTARTVTTRDSTQLVQASFLSQYNSGAPDSRNTSMEEPCRSVLTENTYALVNPNFITKAYSGRPDGKVISTDGPAGTITTVDGQSIVQPKFIVSSNGGAPAAKVSSVDNPARVITTADNKQLVQANFIVQRNGGDPESRVISTDGPARTITGSGGNQDLVQTEFILNYNHTSEHNSLEGPAPAIVAADKLALVHPSFLANYNGKGENIKSVDEPAGTLTTKDRFVKVQTVWLDKQYTGSANHQSVEQPAGAILGNDKHCLMQPEFINRPFSGGGTESSIEDPAGSLLSVPKLNLVQTKFIVSPHHNNGSTTTLEDPFPTITAGRKHHLLINPQYNNSGASVDQPCFTLIASMNKMPPYLVVTECGELAIEVYDDDFDIVVKIKELMALYGISDIKMRMLKVGELLKIQGFPGDYYLMGSQADKKKFIGNSVVPHVVRCWCEQLARELENFFPDIYLNAA